MSDHPHGNDEETASAAGGRPASREGSGPVETPPATFDFLVHTLFTQVRWYPRYLRRPEIMGSWGSQLHRQGAWYIWTFTTRTGRCGINAIDLASPKDCITSWHKYCKF
jgi:hypothetical protein